MSEKLKALSKEDESENQKPIKLVHVIGAGAMGGDIAVWCAFQGFRVSLHDHKGKNIAKVIKNAHQLGRKKHLSESAHRAFLDRLIPDFKNDFIKHADLVIEAVPEDLDIKLEIYQDIESRMKADAILASNTSSIPLDKLSKSLKRPERFIGLHFFNPVVKMKLVEIVAHENAEQAVLTKARVFTGQLDRFPVPVSSSPGFLVNRALTPYLMEAMALLDEGVPAEAIDKTAEDFGMPMGPIELADQVGLDICLEVAKMISEQSDSTMATIPGWLTDKVDKGDLGQKTGKGIYAWKDDKPEKEKSIKAKSELTDRLILPLLNACMHCLSNNVIEDEDLLDGALIFGIGFAPFLGGPLNYAHQRGFDDIHTALSKLADEHGERFKPDTGWKAH